MPIRRPFARTASTCVTLVGLVGLGCPRTAPSPRTPEATPAAATPNTPSPAPVHLPSDEHETLELEGTVARTRPEPAKVDDREAALAAVSTGNPEGAREFLRPFVASQPKDLEARLALARAERALGELDRAAATLDDPRGDPKHETVVQLRALVDRDRGALPEAVQRLEAALAKHPQSLPLQGDLVSVLVDLGRADTPAARALMDALYDAYDAGRVRTPAELLAVAQAALARGSKGAFKDANEVLAAAEAGAPVKDGALASDRVVLVRARMFAEKYAAEDAITTYGLLLARDPWHPEALAGAAQVHADALRFAEASRLASEALQVNPEQPDAHAILAKVALIEGRRDEARERVSAHVLHVNARHATGLAVLAGLALMEANDAAYGRTRDLALAASPQNGAFYKELADILGFLHLYPEAEEVLRDGITQAPADPYVRAARGLNLLRLGQEKTAREDLERAWKRDPFNRRTLNVLDLYEQRIDAHYSEQVVGDLTIRLPNEDRELIAPLLAQSVEWSRTELDRAYGDAAGALRLEFFRDPDEFSIRTVGVPSLGAVAVCFGPVITFIGPYHGTHNIENVIRHELGHVYAIRKSRGRVPRWFTEGLSEWESELAEPAWARESAELLQRARRAGKLRRLSELELAFIRAESPAMMEVAYSTAAYAVRYLGRTFGRGKLVAMLEGYGQGETTEALFVRVLGRELPTVEREFEAWFFAELDARVSGWHPAAPGQDVDERDALLHRAEQQIQAGDRDAAITTLEELVHRGGDGYDSRMLLARVLLAGPQPIAAQRHLEAARKHRREAIEPLVHMSELARKLDRPEDEKLHLREALAIDGDSFDPAAHLLMLAELTGDTNDAARALRQARAAAPLHPIALAGHVLALARAGKQREAAATLERTKTAIEGMQGGPPETLVVVALAAHALGDRDLADRAAREALASAGLPTLAITRLRSLVKGG